MEPLTTNRFPIFAAWCYLIARRLGYDEDEAKSLAVTRARLGAAAKAGNLGRGPAPHRGPARVPAGAEPVPLEKVEQLPFIGMRPYVVELKEGVRGVLHSGGSLKVMLPRDYETGVTRKLGEAYLPLLRLLEKLADAHPPEELNRHGYRLWEQFAPMVRDASGHERPPRFGQRGVFDPARVDRLIHEASQKPHKRAA